YITGDPPGEPDFRTGFDVVRAGLSDRLMAKGTAPDPWAIFRAHSALYERVRYPSRSYPETAWEHGIVQEYGRLALDLGYAFYLGGRLDEAERMYRTAIRVAPDYPLPYKNLGVLLLDRGSDPSEVVALWETYLDLNPADPQALAMRRRLDAIRGGSP